MVHKHKHNEFSTAFSTAYNMYRKH